MKPKHAHLLISALLASVLPGISSPLLAASTISDVQSQQKDLQALRGRIEALRKELSTNETARRKAQEEVRQSEGQIRQLQSELDEMGRKRSSLEQRLAELRRQSDELSRRIQAQQAQLEQTLYRQYVAGTPDPLQSLLNGGDPSESVRDNHYLTILAQSRKELVSNFQSDLAAKKRVTADVEDRTAELNTLLSQQKQKQAELLTQRDRRQELVAALSGKLEKQKQEISSLEQDEKRLSKLINRVLAQIAARKAQERQADNSRSSNAKASTPKYSGPPLTGLPSNLRLPVQGQLAGRFGAPREGGGNWKGILIRTARGTPVKAIATGEVVYADYMRGFGNLLILDHGDGFLSIYGYNETLNKRLGDAVKNGETIATVGTNGSDQDYGLYFEIRHKGQPQDPLKWASNR